MRPSSGISALKTQFRAILILLATVLLVTSGHFFGMPVHAAKTPTLYISPSSQPLAPAGSTVTYSVNVSDISPLQPLAGWEIYVRDNNSVLSPVDFTVSSFLGPGFEGAHCVNNVGAGGGVGTGCSANDAAPGTVHSAFSLLGNPVSGNITLFTITYKAVRGPYSLLTFLRPSADSLLFDNSGNSISFTPGFGSYGNVPILPVASFTWTPQLPFAHENVTFNATSSTTPLGTKLLDYSWVFAPINSGSALRHADGKITKQLLETGNWTVTLVVTNDQGISSLPNSQIVEVVPPPPLCRPGLQVAQVPGVCPTIQSAIDSVVPGGTVLVAPGAYHETLSLDKQLRLQGAGRDFTVLTGSIGTYQANLTITGFAVRGALDIRGYGNVVTNNTIIGEVVVADSPATILTDNLIKNSGGLSIYSSPGCFLRRNILENNTFSFGVFGATVADYVQDIDGSNTINGRPIYYFVNVKNPNIPQDAGYLGFVKSSDITIGPRSDERAGIGVLLVAAKNVEIDGLRATEGVSIVYSNNALVQGSTLSGIRISNSDSILIRHNIITGGVGVGFSSNVQILGNNITRTRFQYQIGTTGIAIGESKDDIVAQNFISGHSLGIFLSGSRLNRLEGNIVQDDPGGRSEFAIGILLLDSPLNVFTDNHVSGAYSSLEVSSYHPDCAQFRTVPCFPISDFIQDVDTSNTIDGKPVYYLVGAHDRNVPPSAGYVAIINSTRVTVNSPTLAFSGDGIRIVDSENILIENSYVSPTNSLSQLAGIWALNSSNLTIKNSQVYASFFGDGILLFNCSKAQVAGNVLQQQYGLAFSQIEILNSTYTAVEGNYISNYYVSGISLQFSAHNIIDRNTLVGFIDGPTGILIYPFGTDRNLIIENTIADNTVGIDAGVGNTIYHNNFVGNRYQAFGAGSTWDNGAGQGNFWSDYKGQDTDGDGVGDTLLPHQGLDNYPLVLPWTPQGLVADFSGRGGWPENRLMSPGDNNGIQTLFAKVSNTGSSPEWVEAVFNVTSSNGTRFSLVSGPVWLDPGGKVTLNVEFAPPLGVYSVTVQLRFSSGAFLTWNLGGTRSFSFEVVTSGTGPSDSSGSTY